uniref:Uncharacterized protein n=1 Tax=Panagrolaimus sp. ES5 TaxID=591445 RepID=A0AC34FLN4_9BILA
MELYTNDTNPNRFELYFLEKEYQVALDLNATKIGKKYVCFDVVIVITVEDQNHDKYECVPFYIKDNTITFKCTMNNNAKFECPKNTIMPYIPVNEVNDSALNLGLLLLCIISVILLLVSIALAFICKKVDEIHKKLYKPTPSVFENNSDEEQNQSSSRKEPTAAPTTNIKRSKTHDKKRYIETPSSKNL